MSADSLLRKFYACLHEEDHETETYWAFVYNKGEEHVSCHCQEMSQIKTWGDKWDFIYPCDFNLERLLPY